MILLVGLLLVVAVCSLSLLYTPQDEWLTCVAPHRSIGQSQIVKPSNQDLLVVLEGNTSNCARRSTSEDQAVHSGGGGGARS